MTTIEKKTRIAELRQLLEDSLKTEGEEVWVGNLKFERNEITALVEEFDRAMRVADTEEIQLNKDLFPTKLICGKEKFLELISEKEKDSDSER